jgi:hypothetical protein
MPASIITGKPRRKKGLVIGLAIAAFVCIIGAGSAAAYFGYIAPNKPENILKAALANSVDPDKLKSENFEGELSVKDNESKQTFSATYNGAATADGVFQMQADVDAVVTKVKLEMRSADGKSMYLKVSGLTGLPQLLSDYGDEAAQYAPFISRINNQWFEINESLLSSAGLGGGFKMSQADREKVAKAYQDHQFLTVKQKLKDEKVADMQSHHLQIVIDKQQLKDYLKALKDAKLDSAVVTQEQLDTIDDGLKDVDLNKYPIDVWIDKATKQMNQLKFAYSDNDVTVTFRMTVTAFNKPVTVTKPTGAKSLLELISELMYGNTNPALIEELESTGISL